MTRTNYKSERVFATASDGTKIPMSLVYRKNVKLDGSAPLLLYGYGSYGVSISPGFSASRLVLLDRGVVFAIAHIRGGGELGEAWREAGRMMNKMNTFTDFIASAEASDQEQIHVEGSPGDSGRQRGRLVGGRGVSNMRPDLFKAVVSQVPFVDVLNTMLDASLPLTTSEYIEWGNPNEKAGIRVHEEVFAVRQHSQGELSGDAGEGFAERQPGAVLGRREVRRETARLQDGQESAAAENQHGRRPRRRSGRYDAFRETAFDYAFMLWQMGITN